ncbi:MAG: tetratricopeptide repeat protein [Methanomassiliicoccaceae archaeon]|nr:tetratricopeptide repeat protein [Methanomassiliicoccaceae archaeon]
MSFNPAASDPTSNAGPGRLALGISCLRQGRNAEAFLILSEKGFEKESAAQFALGLCHLRADDPAKAVECFEQALRLLRTTNAPIGDMQTSRDTYLKLAAKQVEAGTYLEPMDADLCSALPKTARHNMLLALIHAYRVQGMTEPVRQLAAGLVGTEFGEFRKTL